MTIRRCRHIDAATSGQCRMGCKGTLQGSHWVVVAVVTVHRVQTRREGAAQLIHGRPAIHVGHGGTGSTRCRVVGGTYGVVGISPRAGPVECVASVAIHASADGVWEARWTLHGATTPPSVVALFEEHLVIRIEHPVVRFAVLSSLCRQLHEALVQREVVSDRVSPSLILSIPVVWKMLRDEIVDAVERESLLGRALDGHGNQSHVRIGRLHALHFILSVVCVHLAHGDGPGRDGGHRFGRCFVVFAHCHGLLESQSDLAFAVVSLGEAVGVASRSRRLVVFGCRGGSCEMRIVRGNGHCCVSDATNFGRAAAS